MRTAKSRLLVHGAVTRPKTESVDSRKINTSYVTTTVDCSWFAFVVVFVVVVVVVVPCIIAWY